MGKANECPNCGAPVDGPTCPYCGTVHVSQLNLIAGERVCVSLEYGGIVHRFDMMVEGVDMNTDYETIYGWGGCPVHSVAGSTHVDIRGLLLPRE